MQCISILIDPKEEEWFDAFGKMTKDREEATVFESVEAADGAAALRFGQSGKAFWNSEREHERQAATRYRGWKHRIEKV